MPGGRLLRLAREWFDEGTVTRVFEPLIADWQHEWRSTGHWTRRRRAILAVRWYGSFFCHVFRCRATELRADSPAVVTRAYAGTLGLASLASTAALIAYVMILAPNVLYARVPAALGLAAWLLMILIPLAMLPATMMAVGAGVTRRQILRLVAGSIVLIVVFAGWLGPLGQGVRSDSSVDMRQRSALARGRPMSDPEIRRLKDSAASSRAMSMTLPELWRARHSTTVSPDRVVGELNRRGTLPLLAVALASLGAGLMRRGRGRSLRGVLVCWVVVCAALLGVWFLLVLIVIRAALPIWAHPWLALVAVLAAALLVWRADPAPIDRDQTLPAGGL